MAIIVSGSMGIDSLDAYFLMSVFSLGVFNTGGCLFLIIFLRLISCFKFFLRCDLRFIFSSRACDAALALYHK